MENITACMRNEKFSPIILLPMVLSGNKRLLFLIHLNCSYYACHIFWHVTVPRAQL
jgi:hypothetical protein